MVGFAGTAVDPQLDDLVRRGVRSFILFARNVETAEGLRSLTARLQELCDGNAIIAIDHEGGTVNQLRGVAAEWPSAMAHSATFDCVLAEEAYAAAGHELTGLGITLNFAPVADVLGDYRNPVLGTRTFSDDPECAARFVSAAVRGYARAGIASAGKHFPGHGFTPVDSHHDLPRVDRPLRKLEAVDLVPFHAALRAGVDAMMISHVWYSTFDREPTPATLSKDVLRLARSLPFDGPIFTDCMEMQAIQRLHGTGEAVVRAVLAGCDMQIVSHRPDRQRAALEALTDAIAGGRIAEHQAREAAERIGAIRVRPRRDAVGGTWHASDLLARHVAERGVTLVRRGAALPLGRDEDLPILSFCPETSPVTGDENRGSLLGQELRARGVRGRDIEVVPHGTDIQQLSNTLSRGSTVLVQTAFATGHPEQGEMVRELCERGHRVVAVANRDPFDLLSYPDVDTYLVMYGAVGPCARIAAGILVGEVQAQGRLPVSIPGLYERGHGET